MSIYATLWKLKFPKEGDNHPEYERLLRKVTSKLRRLMVLRNHGQRCL
jgi:hypothetical protein